MNWQPIDTAPKDGTPVLLWTAEGITEASYYYGRWSYFPVEAAYEGGTLLMCKPTHWCPVPEAPTCEHLHSLNTAR